MDSGFLIMGGTAAAFALFSCVMVAIGERQEKNKGKIGNLATA